MNIPYSFKIDEKDLTETADRTEKMTGKWKLRDRSFEKRSSSFLIHFTRDRNELES